MSDLLGRVLAGGAGPFALLYRPESGAPDAVDVLSGAVTTVERIADLPLRDAHRGHDLLALVPYRQIVERGFVAPDDGAPLLALVIEEQESAALSDVLDRISEHPVVVGHRHREPSIHRSHAGTPYQRAGFAGGDEPDQWHLSL
ncbi:putative phenazine biosynthesis protein PhzE [Mycobacteroides abscessus subsp. abscessus]|nr:putative phenazine biosynthesis protein PhzE [Mycobacteroides abscessus subsp. abscessus]